ncbi:WD40/YVTN/BNR-like repeat-containing protein [Massilia genomosp. 1]|uniref:Uncharacterized protein n=1 Tax=Massilia genomosp. 1 TaxID=2609280 RepID=A0ABX0N136_9BURK|nr:hypothetical protein [Massilia genomosp. 1]NHZ66730.1 hypothetical protein [Massilia genomosp. 1]
MKLDQESYEEHFSGFILTDCVVRSKEIFYYVLENIVEDYRTEAITRIVVSVNMPEIDPWDHVALTSMHRLTAGVSRHPKEQFIGVSMNDHVYVMGAGEDDFEDDLKGSESSQLKLANASADQFLLRGGISRLRTIDGRLYGCGLGRTVIERVERNEWRYHTDLPTSKHFLDPFGFKDLDGFSTNDIYAVGGKGDVWYFDGNIWKQIPFPSNMDLHSVCCGEDGFVYIGAESGNVFKGRGNKWSMIAESNLSLPFRDMVWHQDTLWCTSDYGLWTIKNNHLIPASVPAGIKICSGNLSVGDGVMLLAGERGAAVHDGNEWKRIIDYNELR